METKKIIEISKKIYTNVKTLIINLYTKLKFIMNKRNTIRKMYQPMIHKRKSINDKFYNHYKALNSQVKSYSKDLNELSKINNSLNKEIDSLQKLIIESSKNEYN